MTLKTVTEINERGRSSAGAASEFRAGMSQLVRPDRAQQALHDDVVAAGPLPPDMLIRGPAENALAPGPAVRHGGGDGPWLKFRIPSSD